MTTAVIGTMAVKLAAKTDKFEADLKKASGKLNKIADAAKKVAAVSGAAFAAIAAGAFVAVRAADQQRRAEIKLASARKAAGKAVDLQGFRDMADALQDATGQGDELTLSQAALLTSLGASKQAIADILPGIADYAAATGKNAQKATLNLGRAIKGEFSLLKTMALGLSEAEVATFKLATEQQRAAIIADKLKTAFGGTAAALSRTAVGAFSRVQGRIGDLTQEIGFLIDEPLAKFFLAVEGAVKTLTSVMSKLSPTTKSAAGTFILLSGGVTGAIAGISALAIALPSLVAGFKIMIATAKVLKVALAGAFGPLGLLVAAATAVLGFFLGKLIAIRAEIAELEAARPQLFDEKAARALDARLREEQRQEQKTREKAQFEAEIGVKKGDITKLLDNLNKASNGLGRLAKSSKKLTDEQKRLAAAAKRPTIQVQQDLLAALPETGGVSDVIADLDAEIEQLESETGGVANALAKGAKQFSAALSILASGVQQGGKEIGGVFNAAASTLAQGGSPLQAAVAAGASLIVQTQEFQEIMQSLNRIFAVAKLTIGKVLKPFVPLIDNLVSMALIVIKLAETFSGLGTLMEGLGMVGDALVVIVNQVFGLFAKAVNSVINFLIKAAKTILFGSAERRAVRALKRARIDIEPQEEGLLDDVLTGSIQDFMRQGDDPSLKLGDAAKGAAGDIDGMGEAARRVSEELTNVATGFKINLRRFQSAIGEEGIGPIEERANVGDRNFFIEVQDTTDLVNKLAEVNATDNANVFRSNEKPSGTFSTSRRGS